VFSSVYLCVRLIFLFIALTRQNLDHVHRLRRILPTVDLLAVNHRIPRGMFVSLHTLMTVYLIYVMALSQFHSIFSYMIV